MLVARRGGRSKKEAPKRPSFSNRKGALDSKFHKANLHLTAAVEESRSSCPSVSLPSSNPSFLPPTLSPLSFPQGPIFTADAVLGRDGFLAGAEASYDVRNGKLSRYNLAAGFHAPEYAVTIHGLGNLSTFSASYYHRVNSDIEASARATYDSKGASNQVNLEVGTKT